MDSAEESNSQPCTRLRVRQKQIKTHTCTSKAFNHAHHAFLFLALVSLETHALNRKKLSMFWGYDFRSALKIEPNRSNIQVVPYGNPANSKNWESRGFPSLPHDRFGFSIDSAIPNYTTINLNWHKFLMAQETMVR
jgi:hypothetical protein